MIQKSIKIGIQRLLSYKAYSLINIGGLAIAISVCLVILLYTQHHSSFDKYIPNVENSYRIISRIGDGTYSTNTYAAFDDVLSNCPEVESHTMCFTNHNIDEVIVDENKIKIESAVFVNESFLKYFSVKILEGDIKSINQPNKVMVTPDMADKLFPGKNAIGQTIFLRSFTRNQDSLIAFSVSGIIDPLPKTSHIKYDIMLSLKGHFSPTVNILKTRKAFGSILYLKLYPAVNVPELEKKLTALIKPVLINAYGPPIEDTNHKLQAVRDIHFTPGLPIS